MKESYPIDLLPPEYHQLKDYQKVAFMISRSGWSLHQALHLLAKVPQIPADKAQELHEMVNSLRVEVEELFWRTHPSAWRNEPP